MAKYLLGRVLRALLTLFVIVTLVFLLLRQMPVEGYFQNYEKMTEAQIASGLKQLGLDRPVGVQLIDFYSSLARGDLGVSHVYRAGVPVTEILSPKIPVSLLLGSLLFLIH